MPAWPEASTVVHPNTCRRNKDAPEQVRQQAKDLADSLAARFKTGRGLDETFILDTANGMKDFKVAFPFDHNTKAQPAPR
jgi:hypothetical protein